MGDVHSTYGEDENDVEQGGRKPIRRHTATKSDSDDDTHVAT